MAKKIKTPSKARPMKNPPEAKKKPKAQSPEVREALLKRLAEMRAKRAASLSLEKTPTPSVAELDGNASVAKASKAKKTRKGRETLPTPMLSETPQALFNASPLL
jgi:hypothetical protein